MLDDYIKELIANNNRVIIPNFGAFLLRATSKNKNKKELSEKIEDIYFSPFLKFNDELLVNHIIRKEGDDQSGAMDKINKYIKTIEQQVKDEGSYTIEKLGDFYMDDQGKIQFKVHGNASREKPSGKQQTGKEAQSAKTINEQAAEGKKSSSEKKSEKKEPTAKAGTEPPKASAPSGQAKTHNGATQAKGKKTHTPPPPPKGKSRKTKEKAGSGSNRGLILSIAIGVPIAVIFIWAMLNFDTVQELFRKDRQQVNIPQQTQTSGKNSEKDKARGESKARTQSETSQSTPESTPEKTSANKQTVAGQSGSQQPDNNQQRSLNQGKKYYLVAGSFRKRQNAVNFRKKLIDQGYNAEMIGERNGMHAVSYASFRNKSKAQNELRRIREEEGLTAWLLYY